MTTDPALLTVREAGDLIRTKALSPVELTAAVLRRIARFDGPLVAHITVTAEWALERARAAEEEIAVGNYRGRVHGIPIGLKDLYATAGVLTTAGSGALRDNIPSEHATTVAKLLDAGAVIAGKHNLHEFAMGGSGINPHFGTVRNPWNAARTAGGSSSGTGAAVAAGLCLAGLGSDTGGSIRIPAAYCGLAGLKPTYGRVSVRGVYPFSWTLDHAGPMTKSVEDAAIVLDAIAGFDPEEPYSMDARPGTFFRDLKPEVRGMRVGVIEDFLEDPRLEEAVKSPFLGALGALEDLGARLVDVRLPEFEETRAAMTNIVRPEASVGHADLIASRPEGYEPALLERIRGYKSIPSSDVVEAYRIRARAIRIYDRLMQGFDVLAGPTVPIAAPDLETLRSSSAAPMSPGAPPFAIFAGIFNLTGQPALSIPCGFDSNGVPVGFSLIGKRWDEQTVLNAGAAYQAATDWHTRRPPLG
jgi:aspartyl-tRNA(Asn)/glutamyl-tRNA(Gln) amidotransferase subunit A